MYWRNNNIWHPGFPGGSSILRVIVVNMNEMNHTSGHNEERNVQDQVDLKEIWRVIRSYRKSLAVIFIVVLGITIYVTVTTRPYTKQPQWS